MICFLFPVLIMLIPESDVFSHKFKLFLAITLFAIAIFATEVVNMLMASLLLMTLYPFFGVAPMSKIFGAWSIPVPWITLSALIIVVIVQRTTLMQRVAYWTIIKSGASYIGILLAITTLGIIFKIFLQAGLAIISVGVIAFSVYQNLGINDNKMKAGIVLAAAIAYNDIFSIYQPDTYGLMYAIGSTIVPVATDHLRFFYENAIFSFFPYIVALGIYCITKPKEQISNKAVFVELQSKLPPLSLEEKKIMGLLIAFVLFLFTVPFHKIDMIYGFLATAIILFLPGFNIGTKEDIQKVNFSMVFFTVACIAIGIAGNSVKIGQLISTQVVPLISDISEIPFLFIVYFFTAAMNFLMTPLAEIAAFTAPLTQICVDLGFNVETMFYTFWQGVGQVLLPYEVAPFLIVAAFANISVKDFAKIMGLKFILNTIFLSTFGFGYWKFIGLI